MDRVAVPRRPGVLASLGSDDLLAETLVSPDVPSEHERDYTDDLEDLVRMRVTQQLHSRRSHHTLDLSTRADAFPSEPASPTSPTPRSLIPRPHHSASSSRSPSPEIPRKERTGSMSSSASLSRIPTSTAMLRGHSNTSATSTPPDDPDVDPRDWQTLQVAAPRPSGRAAAAVRKRAQSSRTPRGGGGSTSRRPAATTTNPTPTPRKPYANRTNLTPSPSTSTSTSTSKPRTTAKAKNPAKLSPAAPRRKSISTPREFSSYDLSSLPPEAFSPPPPPSSSLSPAPPPPPPPVALLLSDSLQVAPDVSRASAHPLVYKNSKGQLTDRGRAEDRIVPTVANRLEAERLRRLLDEGGLADGAVLLDEWGVDGTPRSQRTVARGVGVGGGGGRTTGGELEAGRETTTGTTTTGAENVVGPTADDRARARHQDGVEEPPRRDGDSVDARPDEIRADATRPVPLDSPTRTPRSLSAQVDETLASNRRTAQEERDAGKAGCCSCVIC